MLTGEEIVDKKFTFHDLKEQEKEARKQLIIDAAIRLFSRKSISNVSIRDIAKEAGISPALIYRYFTDRDDLFVASFLRKSEEMLKQFQEELQIAGTLNPEKIGQKFVNFLIENDLFFRMMTHFMLDTSIKEDSMKTFNNSIKQVLDLFDEAFKAIGYQEQIRLHSHAFFAALNGVLITYRHYPGRSEADVQKHIQRLASIISNKFSS
jgi:AcrR family transcriptional regulator